ncbi:hypothetical protein [Kitasatospora sp. NPDC087315]|uniref:hypothetical protein n=1 Tax=Kitasatospora sp. NPDC087315 TaxID=3364069 RepID=UPI0037F4E3C8
MPLPTNAEHILRRALAQAAGTDLDTIPGDGRLEQDLGIDSPALGRLTTDADIRSLLARLDPQPERTPL